jgi:hypothetical protein
MKYQLDSRFRIDTDSHNWILRKEEASDRINKKTGEPFVSKDAWYFPKLHVLLKTYRDEHMKDIDPSSIDQILDEIKRVEAKIDACEAFLKAKNESNITTTRP